VSWSSDPRPHARNPNGYFEKKDGTLVRWNPLVKTAAAP
jgi:hypothetical protein